MWQKVILHEHAADFVEYYHGSDNKQGINDTLKMCDALIVLSQSWKEYFHPSEWPRTKFMFLTTSCHLLR